MNLSDELTVVIPTYNRRKYLERSLCYWGQKDFEVIVADGSQQKFVGKMPSNVSYYYFDSQVSIGQRFFTAVKKVRTPYVVLCADDDFLSESGLLACIDFLNNFPDHVSAQGHVMSFTIHGKENIAVEILNVKNIGHHIGGDTAAERLNQLFDEYVYQSYSVCRTPMLQLAFETCKTTRHPDYLELGAAVVPSISGKHLVLPVFYSARENSPPAERSTFERPRFDILEPQGLADYEQWRDKASRIYSDAEGVSLDVALSIIQHTFDKYLAWDLRTFPNHRPLNDPYVSVPESISVKNLLKKIIPPALLAARLKVLTKFGYRKEEDLCPNVPGFPWSDPSAEKDWKHMVDLIMKYEE